MISFPGISDRLRVPGFSWDYPVFEEKSGPLKLLIDSRAFINEKTGFHL
jgi:hypothetical protein